MIHGLIGVVHLPPLPGDPRHDGESGFDAAEQNAIRDAEALVRGGADALLIENFGSAPFVKGTAGDRLPPHQVSALAIIARRCASRFDVPVGVNCLRNDAQAALGIAAAAGLAFVRVNVHTGAYVTDQGIIEGEAASSLRYRDQLGARHVGLLADILVKHAAPLAPLSAEGAARDTLIRGLADGLIVTGDATGAPVDTATLTRVREAIGEAPLLVGSGMTLATAPSLAPMVQGAIVGTWVKQNGDVLAPVDEERVRRLADAVQGRFRPLPGA